MDALLNEIIEREGRLDTNDPADAGGRTKFGISQRFHPDAWKNGPPTVEEAKQIYLTQYIIEPNIHLIKPDYLAYQVADFAVLSGPSVAIKHLQKILNVEADGQLGPMTLTALSHRDPEQIHQLLVKARVLALARVVQRRPSDVKWLFGWLTRALSFLRA